MEQGQFETFILDYLSGNLNQNDRVEFELLIENNPDFKERFDEMTRMWNPIEESELPVVGDVSEDRFYQALHNQVQLESKGEMSYWNLFLIFLEPLFGPKQLVYGIFLLTLGVGFGYLLSSSFKNDQQTEIVVDDSNDLREKYVLTLLEQPSVNKRLQGIGEASKISHADISIINALFQTLNHDPNVNVRLASIKSLSKYTDNALVREGLVESILMQHSPIVQVTLANLMVELQEKNSVEPFRILISKEDLDSSVREKLELSVKAII
jgi:hypothetical protein